MAKTGNFYHSSTVTLNRASVGTSFDVAKFHEHDLGLDGNLAYQGSAFFGYVEGLYVRVTAIAGGAKTITARITCDPEGDFSFFPDTEADIAAGLTTTNTGVVAYEFKLPIKQFFGTEKLYVFIKVDAGTVTLANSCIVWSE
jgi:hypothetical protein